MKEISCILTYRSDKSNAREANLRAVLKWLSSWPKLKVVLVEQDTVPRLGNDLANPAVRRIFAFNPGQFNKSWGLNIGAVQTTTPWLLFLDADIIFGSAIVNLVHATSGPYRVIKPFMRLHDLDVEETQRVRAGDFDWFPERSPGPAADRECSGEFPPFAGGAVAISRHAFLDMGGWDERFVGWGGEDDAMSYLLERSRVPGIELDLRPAVHLFHPRNISETVKQPSYTSNLRLLAEYRTLSDDQLIRQAEIRRQLNAHLNKYAPCL
ncbi:MAG: galactosyltransferase-related protein [Wenzhouxiangella sp.]